MRLGLKLTLSFLAVGLTGVALIALLASRNTRREFEDFIFEQYRSGFIEQLADFYSANGSWAGVESVLPFREVLPLERGHDLPPGGALTATDASGVVLIPGFGREPGEQVPPEERAAGLPIQVAGQTVGWVLREQEPLRASPAEAAFVRRIQTMLIEGALGAAALSLLLGAGLARALTRPIRDLTLATRGVAEGNFEQKVRVRSNDELGRLATSFNLMSAELARAQALRRQMTADIAHELRTPISTVLGHADAIHDGVLPMTMETVEVIRDQALRLERLVEDLRVLSRADAGELTLVPEPTPVLAMIQQAVRAHRPEADQKFISMEVEVEPGLPEIQVDRDRMSQVLGNLLGNALRHTPQGGVIRLTAARAGADIELRVHDNGPGIPPEDLPHIFERLYRPDRSRQRETGGSGLGLAIAKSIVVSHGGRIHAESEPGRGTVIVVRIPISLGEAVAEAQRTPPA